MVQELDMLVAAYAQGARIRREVRQPGAALLRPILGATRGCTTDRYGCSVAFSRARSPPRMLVML